MSKKNRMDYNTIIPSEFAIKKKHLYYFFKRVFDIVCSSLALIVLSWFLLIIGILVKCTSKGPMIYASDRVGKNGKVFKFYKFRSMKVDADKELEDLLKYNQTDGITFKMKDDPRITKFGKFIRKTSIDELPQLWNIFKGDMSFVGPRPCTTRDTYEAMMKAKEYGIKAMSIVNVKGSTITRDADINVYTYAGPEIAVATTKAYSCQLIVLYLFAVAMARAKNKLEYSTYEYYLKEIKSIPSKINRIIEDKEEVQKLANVFVPMKDVFFIGRGIDYAICMEGALKLKEVTYINANAYAAGELKHGTISLIDKKVGAVSILTQENLFEKTQSNMVEIKAREGNVFAVTTYGNYKVDEASQEQMYVPEIEDIFGASLAIVPVQLLSYYVSVGKGIDPDKPKNLAKSVTVE